MDIKNYQTVNSSSFWFRTVEKAPTPLIEFELEPESFMGFIATLPTNMSALYAYDSLTVWIEDMRKLGMQSEAIKTVNTFLGSFNIGPNGYPTDIVTKRVWWNSAIIIAGKELIKIKNNTNNMARKTKKIEDLLTCEWYDILDILKPNIDTCWPEILPFMPIFGQAVAKQTSVYWDKIRKDNIDLINLVIKNVNSLNLNGASDLKTLQQMPTTDGTWQDILDILAKDVVLNMKWEASEAFKAVNLLVGIKQYRLAANTFFDWAKSNL